MIMHKLSKSLTAMLAICVLVLSAFAVDKTWDVVGSAEGDWASAASWNPSGVPTSSDDVFFDCYIGRAIVHINSSISPVASLIVRAKGANFELGRTGRMEVLGSVTNFVTSSFRGGSAAINGDLVIGNQKGWGLAIDSASSNVKCEVQDCRLEVGGDIWATGYANNGLVLNDGAFVSCNWWRDSGGTRNATYLGPGSVLYCRKGLELKDGYPKADAFPNPFIAEGAVVTNDGELAIANGNAGEVPFVIRGGTRWIQRGRTRFGESKDGHRFELSDGSVFASEGDFSVGGYGKRNQGLSVLIENSVMTNAKVTVANDTSLGSTFMCIRADEGRYCELVATNGMIIGASFNNANYTRYAASTVSVENATLVVDKDFRLGALNNNNDLGTNVLAISGRRASVRVSYRMLTGAEPQHEKIHFKIPEGGYESGAAIHGGQIYLSNADITIDASKLKGCGESVLVQGTSIQVDTNRVHVIATHLNRDYALRLDKKVFSIRLKESGFIISVR